ncbi:methyltransferase domain-containing protein [Streptomyces anulatus]|uniref:class I SAM-dependent methyltransferase n=1 Tax=Streptomyces anulatus TaxID=1892 RepID=UPI002E334695|nr:methyltransferase domain-containing protein [Streptomyces anulatus]
MLADANLCPGEQAKAAMSVAFDHGSAAYDRLVPASPGYHAHLRRSARRLCLPGEGKGLRVLDLGCGTGASTAALLAAAPRARIAGVDASAGMLDRATAKSWPQGVDFEHHPVEELAGRLETGSFDAVFAGYLFRNITDPNVRSVVMTNGSSPQPGAYPKRMHSCPADQESCCAKQALMQRRSRQSHTPSGETPRTRHDDGHHAPMAYRNGRTPARPQ